MQSVLQYNKKREKRLNACCHQKVQKPNGRRGQDGLPRHLYKTFSGLEVVLTDLYIKSLDVALSNAWLKNERYCKS